MRNGTTEPKSDGPWRTIGSIGDMTCFSFYATRTLTMGEGGMLATEKEEWAERTFRCLAPNMT